MGSLHRLDSGTKREVRNREMEEQRHWEVGRGGWCRCRVQLGYLEFKGFSADEVTEAKYTGVSARDGKRRMGREERHRDIARDRGSQRLGEAAAGDKVWPRK